RRLADELLLLTVVGKGRLRERANKDREQPWIDVAAQCTSPEPFSPPVCARVISAQSVAAGIGTVFASSSACFSATSNGQTAASVFTSDSSSAPETASQSADRFCVSR